MPTKDEKQKKRAKGINKSEPPRRAQKPTFKRVFLPRLQIYHQDKKGEQSAQKTAKRRRFYYCEHIIGNKQSNINAIRPFCAYIILLYYCMGASPFATPSRYAVVSRFL